MPELAVATVAMAEHGYLAPTASAVMEGLMWTKPTGDAHFHETTKGGMPFYNGTVVDFEEWRFRLKDRYDSLTGDDAEEKRKELAAKVIDGLTGEALRIAMDLGVERAICPEVVITIIGTIRNSIEGKKVQESKQLY